MHEWFHDSEEERKIFFRLPRNDHQKCGPAKTTRIRDFRFGTGRDKTSPPGPARKARAGPGRAGPLWPPADGNNSIQTKNVQFNSSVNQRLKLPSGRHEPVRIVSQKTLHGTPVPSKWVPQKKAHAWMPESSKRTCPISCFRTASEALGPRSFSAGVPNFVKNYGLGFVSVLTEVGQFG